MALVDVGETLNGTGSGDPFSASKELWRLRLRKKNSPKMIKAITATPEIIPPTIAPVFEDFLGGLTVEVFVSDGPWEGFEVVSLPLLEAEFPRRVGTL